MQENPNKNSAELSPKIELSLGKMQEKCLEYFNELSADDKKNLDYELNMVSAPDIDRSIELAEDDDLGKLNKFLELLARYKLCKNLEGEEAKKDAGKALKDIAKLF